MAPQFDEHTNYEAVKAIDWNKVNANILSEAKPGSSFDWDKGNKSKLLHLILKATGIKFTDIKMTGATDQLMPREFNTNSTRPELGVCTRWIDEFQFGLYKREPQTIGKDVYLSYAPSLGYSLIEGGSNGFGVGHWFYYDCQRQEWYME